MKITLRGFSITNKSLKRKQMKRVNDLYKQYQKQTLKLNMQATLLTKGQFIEGLFQRAKGQTIQNFMSTASSHSAGVLTTYQAKLAKNEAIELGIDTNGLTLQEIRGNKEFQSQIYNAMKAKGLDSYQLKDWWSEYIIGSI